jgi:hypothetical protein
MAEIEDILEKVLRATVNGKLQWKATADKDTFIAGLEGKFTLLVQDLGSRSFEPYYFSMSDSGGNVITEQTVYNPSTPMGSEPLEYDRVKSLYSLARRNTLDIDRKLSDAASMLDKL